jgi:hypothetical protein
MKKSYIFIFFVLLTFSAKGQKQDNWLLRLFLHDQRLRIDLVFAGNSEKQEIFLKGLHKEKEWSVLKQTLFHLSIMESITCKWLQATVK